MTMDGPQIVMAITMAITPFGLAFNILSVLVLRQYPKQRSAEVYLQALAICDCISLLFDGFVDGAEIIFQWNPFRRNSVSCKIDMMMDYVSTYVTYWLIVVITVDRAVMIWRPMFHRNHLRHGKNALKVVFGVLLVTYLVCGPLVLYIMQFHPRQSDEMMNSCSVNGADKARTVLLFLGIGIGAVTPLLIVIIANSYLLYHIRKHFSEKEDQQMTKEKAKQQKQIFNEYLILILSVSITFVVLCGTSQVLTLYHKGKQDAGFKKMADSLDELLNVTNSSVNFFLYCLSSRDFRKNLMSLAGTEKQALTHFMSSASNVRSPENRTTEPRSVTLKVPPRSNDGSSSDIELSSM